ncbi:MAG: hypothetical protein KF742_03740 [Cryobacterium sp.]|nr:hypothetical protein [Cryobacterium sp.]
MNELYNKMNAGLVLSLSNMSLLPLELLGAGVIPVVNDAPNNRMVSNNPNISFAPADPASLASRLVEIVDDPNGHARSRAASESVAELTWDASGRQFLAAFDRGIHG